MLALTHLPATCQGYMRASPTRPPLRRREKTATQFYPHHSFTRTLRLAPRFLTKNRPPPTHVGFGKFSKLQHACFVTFSPSHAKEITRQKWRCLVIHTHTRTFAHLESDFREKQDSLGLRPTRPRALCGCFSPFNFLYFSFLVYRGCVVGIRPWTQGIRNDFYLWQITGLGGWCR